MISYVLQNIDVTQIVSGCNRFATSQRNSIEETAYQRAIEGRKAISNEDDPFPAAGRRFVQRF